MLVNESKIIETVSTRMKQLINRVRKPMDSDKYVLLDFIQKASTNFVPIDDGYTFESMTKSGLIGFLLGQEWIFGFGEMGEFEWTPFIHVQFSGHIVPYKELFVYLPRKDLLNLKGTDLEKYVSERFFDMANRKSIFEVDFMSREHRKQIEVYMLEKRV
ncbi:hypothetical protein [Bacillus cereus]|uniref:hypothetical protein n=2 Tax=Bacillus TaxID=1386 RepID=UPI002DB82FB5|nr:hypothetical protein [Bacillus cereus]